VLGLQHKSLKDAAKAVDALWQLDPSEVGEIEDNFFVIIRLLNLVKDFIVNPLPSFASMAFQLAKQIINDTALLFNQEILDKPTFNPEIEFVDPVPKDRSFKLIHHHPTTGRYQWTETKWFATQPDDGMVHSIVRKRRSRRRISDWTTDYLFQIQRLILIGEDLFMHYREDLLESMTQRLGKIPNPRKSKVTKESLSDLYSSAKAETTKLKQMNLQLKTQLRNMQLKRKYSRRFTKNKFSSKQR
jgi:hypothetical protein